jgi:hypothetical protein
VFGLIMLFIRLVWLMLVVELWLCWALIALMALIICSATHNQRAARSWSRSLSWHTWHRIFDPF